MTHPPVWWLVEGRHQVTVHHNKNPPTWETQCGLTISDNGTENCVTTIRPAIACGRCMTADARRNIDAIRTKQAGNTTKYSTQYT